VERLPHGDPWLPPAPVPPPRFGAPRHSPRRRVHLLLALGTLVTLALAGGAVWQPVDPPIESVFEWLHPGRFWSTLLAGRWYGVWVFAILGAHEMGHYVACRMYGIPATLPFFLPSIPPIGTFGAVIRIRGRIPHRRALFDVAAAGPIAGFAITVPVLVYGVMHAQPFVPPEGVDPGGTIRLGEPVLLMLLQRFVSEPGELAVNGWIGAGWVGLLVTSLNLFPVGQLDGGHVVYALSRRAHRILAFGTLAALFGVIVVQLVVYRQFPFYVVWFAILLWMRDRHPRLLDESAPLGRGRGLVAALLATIFALSFILVPLYVD
jgi:membrane-associated protease RseP (regulator of RpoE activity)